MRFILTYLLLVVCAVAQTTQKFTNIQLTATPVEGTSGNVVKLLQLDSSGIGESVTPIVLWAAIVTQVTAATIKTNLSLQNVDNTSDANKPVSTAQQTALDLKANLAGAAFTGNISTTGTATVGSGGTAIVKVISATGVLDFPQTDGGAIADLTVAATGAALGDVVSIGVPNASITNSGCFFAWVSSADTVTVRFVNNELTGTLNPASGTFRVMVTKF